MLKRFGFLPTIGVICPKYAGFYAFMGGKVVLIFKSLMFIVLVTLLTL